MIFRRAVLAAMVVAAFAVAGCGGGNDEKTASGTTATATDTPAATPTETQDADADSGSGEDADKDKGDDDADAGGADKSCADVGDITGDPKTKPPADVPFPGGAHVYESQGPFGKTTRYFAVVDGGPDDLPKVRDDASDILVENGYKLNAKDQEEGAEAEAHLAGKHDVDVQVISLCQGKLRLRLTVS